MRAGGTGSDVAGPVAMDAAGNITVAGTCKDPAGFGATTLTSSCNYSMAFVARLNSQLLVTHAVAPNDDIFALAPNPTTGAVRLTWPGATAVSRPVQLLGAVGREVRRQVLPAHADAATLDVTGLAPGLYVGRCGAAASRLQVE